MEEVDAPHPAEYNDSRRSGAFAPTRQTGAPAPAALKDRT